MRTIKFRAWNGKDLIYPDDRGWFKGFKIKGFRELQTVRLDSLFENGIPVEQFTGLLDKNGKEIYEGDILRIEKMWQSKYQTVVVRFEQGAFALYPNMTEKVNCDLFGGLQAIEEVIGNIHENPELLK